MKAELTLPPELIEEIVSRLVERITPLLSNSGQADPLLDVEGLARYLNVKPGWVYQRVHENAIPHVKVGKYPRFDKATIELWLKGQGQDATLTKKTRKKSTPKAAPGVRRLLD